MMYQGFEFTRMINGEPKREVVIIFYPEETDLYWALHQLGFECCLKNQKEGEFHDGLSFPELMEQVTPEMLAPYGMTVLWPNRALISMDNMPPTISRYELETYQAIYKSHQQELDQLRESCQQQLDRMSEEY